VELIEAGKRSVTNSPAVVRDIDDLHAADPLVRGILGDSFLEHFDLLIDNRRKILCLDDTNSLAWTFKGEHIDLASPLGSGRDLPFTRPMIIAVRVAGSADTPMLLRLDSGSNAPVLYAPAPRLAKTAGEHAASLARIVNGSRQGFELLPAVDLRIGKHIVPQVSFAVATNSVGRGPSAREDGILPTMAFQRIFISSQRRYAAVESW
jgi:hypothetical protein